MIFNKDDNQMKQNVMLTTASVLSILFFTFHLADDIVRGFEPGKLSNLTAVPIFVFWLYGTLVLAGRRSGYVITFLGGLFALVVPLAHMRGKGVGVTSSLAHSSGHFFFVWTVIAIGVTGLFSVILAARRLWGLPWRRGVSKTN
jgi:hypothetical protein